MNYEERLRHLEIPSLAQRRRRGDMIFTYKLITGQMNITKTDFFKMSNLSTRGHQHKIYKQHSSKLLRANVFSTRIVNDWNALPAEIIDAESATAFKNKLD